MLCIWDASIITSLLSIITSLLRRPLLLPIITHFSLPNLQMGKRTNEEFTWNVHTWLSGENRSQGYQQVSSEPWKTQKLLSSSPPPVFFNETIDMDTGTVVLYLQVYHCPYPFRFAEADILNKIGIYVLWSLPK